MDTLLKEFEDMGFKVEVGCKEKRRKKTIFESIKKLKGSGDDDRISCEKIYIGIIVLLIVWVIF